MKYIIEIKPEYEGTTKGIIVLGIKNNCLCVDELAVEELEELNSDYINEHFGDLQDTAYHRGLEEGNDIGYKNGVKDGQNEAWEAARKIIRMSDGDILDLFPDCYASVCTAVQAILKYDASEAIEKLKAYEEKQKADDEIKVGDEVIYNGTTKCIVVRQEDDERYASLIDGDGTLYSADHRECKKTSRHFDIDKILEEMKE